MFYSEMTDVQRFLLFVLAALVLSLCIFAINMILDSIKGLKRIKREERMEQFKKSVQYDLELEEIRQSSHYCRKEENVMRKPHLYLSRMNKE